MQTNIAIFCSKVDFNTSKTCIEDTLQTFCAEDEQEDDFLCTMYEACFNKTGIAEQKICVEDLCDENQDKFECQALKCKQKFPEKKQFKKTFDCIKASCYNVTASSNTTESPKICTVIDDCESDPDNTGFLGKLKIFQCIKNEFVDVIVW